MHIERIRQIDSSEPDESGAYDYYYEYDIYRFTDAALCFVARSYTDEPYKAHFLWVEELGVKRGLVHADLARPLCLMAQSHLLSEGKVHLSWLNSGGSGYEPVPTGESGGV